MDSQEQFLTVSLAIIFLIHAIVRIETIRFYHFIANGDYRHSRTAGMVRRATILTR